MENQTHTGAALLQPRLVRLAPDTRIETTALPSQFGGGPATDCWIVRDDGGDDVLIGYGHDDRATVPRSSISLPNDERTWNRRVERTWKKCREALTTLKP